MGKNSMWRKFHFHPSAFSQDIHEIYNYNTTILVCILDPPIPLKADIIYARPVIVITYLG